MSNRIKRFLARQDKTLGSYLKIRWVFILLTSVSIAVSAL